MHFCQGLLHSCIILFGKALQIEGVYYAIVLHGQYTCCKGYVNTMKKIIKASLQIECHLAEAVVMLNFAKQECLSAPKMAMN